MRERARSAEDKAQRSEDLLDAAESLALELGGVRFVTVAAVTERAGLHRTGVRRYYASKEELLLELAERGWGRWRDAITEQLGESRDLSPAATARIIADTLTSMSVFCDLLSHAAMSLEGDVDIERARRYKAAAFAAHDDAVATLDRASVLSVEQLQGLMATAGALAAAFWQASHPTPSLARLYDEVPEWGHVALEFAPKVRQLLEATAAGLA